MKIKKFPPLYLLAILVLLFTACETKNGIQGTLLDEENQPLTNIRVTLEVNGSDKTIGIQTIQTDEKGKFLFSNLPSGDYLLTVLWDTNPSCPGLASSLPVTSISDFMVIFSENASGKVVTAVKELNYEGGSYQEYKLIFPCSAQLSENGEISSVVSDGNKVENFSITTFDNQTYELKDFKGKLVIVNFWSTWAIPSEGITYKLEEISQKYSSNDVVVLGVSYQDGISDAQEYIKNHGITFLNGPDPDNKLAKQFGVTGVPHTIIIDQTGKVLQILPGTKNITLESLSKTIDDHIK